MTTLNNGHSMNWARLDDLFDSMGQEKDRPVSQFWDWARMGDALSQNTGLMILQMKPDFEVDMMTIGGDIRKSRRVSRHLLKVANHFAGIRGEFQKLPATIMNTYAEELAAQRRASRSRRQPINRNKG